ncbi:MAG TPA: hypothetical protein VKA87_02110 [Nitrososphaeraceae archaeon]|nr:hypothetical protein [Nitrososphaeraceae archaeon]
MIVVCQPASQPAIGRSRFVVMIFPSDNTPVVISAVGVSSLNNVITIGPFSPT